MWVTSYNIAYKYLSIAMMLFTIATQPLWPAFADAYARGDNRWMNNAKNKMTKFYFFCLTGCIMMASVAPWIYKIWIGENANVPQLMTWIVTLYILVYCWGIFNGILLVGMSKIKLNTIVATVGMFFHIPLAYSLSMYIGPYGVIVSMIIINLVYGIVYRIQLNKLLNDTASGIWNE